MSRIILLLLVAQILTPKSVSSGLLLGSNYLTDYKDCGRRSKPLPELTYKYENECFWTCEWMPNPFYRKEYKLNVVDVDDEVDEVTYYMLTRMIPTNLDCMTRCKLPDNKKPIIWQDFYCDDPLTPTSIVNTVDLEEKYNNCYLNWRKRGEKTSFYFAKTGRDIIFDICYVAKLFNDPAQWIGPQHYGSKLCSDIVNCNGIQNKIKLTGLILSNKPDTTTAKKCETFCKDARNLCAGWNWKRDMNHCELFSVVKQCTRLQTRNYNSGLCEAMYDIKTYNGASVNPSECYQRKSLSYFSQQKLRKRNKKKKKQKGQMNRKNKRQNSVSLRQGRLFGASTQHINGGHLYPWVCSLRTFGFRGQHRCAVTLLSAPPKTTVLVSAAHCNYICKDTRDKVVDICCCREDIEPTSCRATSSFCGIDPALTLASPSDLQIVCGEHNIDDVPEAISREIEVVLNVLKFTNHPKYNQTKGPIHGHDIAVYHVNTTLLLVKPGVFYPACLPRPIKSEYDGTKPIILPAWRDPKPKYFSEINNENALRYRSQNLLLRHALLEETSCEDPQWMNSNTYYPPYVQCFRDPTESSCLFFGSSGSSVVRALKRSAVNSSSSDYNFSDEQFAWVGPLSMSKGCDRAEIISNMDSTLVKLGAENPGIFTDGSCYLDWIGREYSLEIDPKLRPRKDLCSPASGDLNDIDRTGVKCRTTRWRKDRQSYCMFSQTSKYTFQVSRTGSVTVTFDRCKLFGVEGYAENLNLCIDNFGELAHCANNCLGVDPNAVVIAGTAVLAATAYGGLGALQSLLVVGSLTTIGAGGMLAMGMCPGPLFCQVGNRCLLLVVDIDTMRLMCPPN